MSTPDPGISPAAKISELKTAADEVLGAAASSVLKARISAALDEASDAASLRAATARVEKLVALIQGPAKAEALADRFRQALG